MQKFYYYSDTTGGRKDLLQVTHRIYENEDPNGVVFEFEDYDTAYFADGYYARPKGLAYPGGTSVAFGYNVNGQLIEEQDPLSSVVYREITAKSSRNQIIAANIGKHSGSFKYSYAATQYQNTGQAKTIVVSGNGAVQNLAYNYDLFGNLATRTNIHASGTTVETLSYDNLQRLTASQRNFGASTADVVYSYDAAGNFESKSDFASLYNYDTPRPHVLTSVSGGISYDVDDNGNVTTRDGDNITYNAANKPLTLSGSAGNASFSYGADLMRYRQTTPSGTTIYYIDKLMEIEKSSSNADYRHYLGDIAILTKTGDLNDPNPGIKYLLRDRLGSVAVIGDTSGFSVETRGSDAFGKPRNGDWTDKTPAIIGSSITDRGFTDHEHLDDWQLIHMNGRGYDYNLGRFLSTDPIIQSPGNSQSINPYTYIGNNPLSGTDPTGYAGVSERDKVDGDAAQTMTVTVKTRRAGSRITTKQNVDVTVSNNASGGVDARLDGGNNGAQLSVAGAIDSTAKAIKQNYQSKLDELGSIASTNAGHQARNDKFDGAEYSSTYYTNHIIDSASKNWPGGVGSDNPRELFESLPQDERERIYGDFKYRLSEIREIWNDPLSDISNIKRILQSIGKVGSVFIRMSGGELYKTTNSQMDAGLYRSAIRSLEAHRRYAGSNKIAPAPFEWRRINWNYYDQNPNRPMGDAVDFLHWIDNRLTRAPERFIFGKAGDQN